jgi:uncharacterized protein (DUF952 family)/GNAT superfamily N-acetyltransferase
MVRDVTERYATGTRERVTGARAVRDHDPMTPLLHLVESAPWRSALATGALRPPSLAAAGFVHLSTPEQVHLPAGRLYPGRRDLALLVVDPERLTDPVRWEPGLPDDPPGMRFPHLYGPLPTAAVVAVVAYRPPTPVVLPAADDVAGRVLASYVSLPVRRAVGVGDVPGGVAVLDPDVPYSHDNNRLVLTGPVEAARIEEAAAEVAGHAGWPDQVATLAWPGAHEVAAELAARGWSVEELLLMACRPAPTDGGRRVEVVEERELHEFWAASWRRALAGHQRLDQVVEQLVAREARNDEVLAVTHLVVREESRVVAAGQLRVDGATAAVEAIETDPGHRGRGYGDAVLARALDLASSAGCDLVALEAAADDWPRRWYARRGFAEVGSLWQARRRG